MYRKFLLVSLFFFFSLFTPLGFAGGVGDMAMQLEMARSIGLSVPNMSQQQVAQPVVKPAPPKDSPLTTLQSLDHAANLTSTTFGANLFTGAFAREGVARFNPDYLVQMGDTISVRLWGAFAFDAQIPVDQKGNIFIPQFGPVQVLNVKNQDLQKMVEAAVRSVYRNNVFVYASLAAAQPVRIYVGGYVNRPGLYDGTSLDSILNYLDQAGGIDPERGSFLNVEVKRDQNVRARINLYDFMLKGIMPKIQLSDGDVIFVPARSKTVIISGLAENTKRFEFLGESLLINEIVAMAKPKASATHVRVIRNTGTTLNIEYFPIKDAQIVKVNNGDELEFTADKKPGTITVRVEGEHQSPQEYVLPYGAKFGDLIKNVELLPSADASNLQLFRKSVGDRQKLMLSSALKNLEASVLTARSSTNEESRLRKDEADMMLQWVERAKKIEPNGQVVVAQTDQRNELLLENGDVVKVPKLDGLVLVSGEVVFPNTIAYESKLTLQDYIKKTGGYSQSADTAKVIVAHRDGSFEEVTGTNWFGFMNNKNESKLVQAGDEILVLPKVQTKSIEVTRAITQILYQMAVSARVIFNVR